MNTVSIFGIGKLGASMAAVIASRGFNVIGVDVNYENCRYLNGCHDPNMGPPPVEETGLAELIQANRDRISATLDGTEAVLASNIIFIVVPTPSTPSGDFSAQYVVEVAKVIGEALRADNKYRLIVLTSTVMPSTMDDVIVPALEEVSGKKCGEDFGCCYGPEFIALGSVIHDMLNPDFVLIGESDAKAGAQLEEFYEQLCENNPPTVRMNFVNAEFSKLSLNCFVTMKISYANMLAGLCEKIPGADVDVVTGAIGLDSRIGSKYLKGATRYAGPCFPRDSCAFRRTAERYHARAELAEATDTVNRRQTEHLANLVLRHRKHNCLVGILGLSYKPDTAVIEESAGIQLVEELNKHGICPVVFDPAAMQNARDYLGNNAVYADSAVECASAVTVLIITTPWKEFVDIPLEAFRRHASNSNRMTVIDCWRILDEVKVGKVANYVVLGKGPLA